MDPATGEGSEVIEVEDSEGADGRDRCHPCEDQEEVVPSELDGGAASAAVESARAPPGTIRIFVIFTKLMSDSLYSSTTTRTDVRMLGAPTRADGVKVNNSELLEERDADAAADADAGLGVWCTATSTKATSTCAPSKAQERIDQRGFERSAHQLEFHEAFFNATARVIYRLDWEVHKPAIMRKNNWKTVQSEVMISTPRRFGKTFSIVCRAAI